MSMNTNKEMLAGNVDFDASYHAADPDGTRLITDYAATDTDLCIRIFFLVLLTEKKWKLTEYMNFLNKH